jgi:CHAD domain-containing protein
VRKYALEHVVALLDRLALEVEKTRSARDADAVHDLRVTIRRFGQSLRVFAPYLPKHAVRQVRAQLRHIIDLAGEVRNRDITLELLTEAKMAAPHEAIRQDRDLAVRILVSELNRWCAEHEAVRWRAALELPSA